MIMLKKTALFLLITLAVSLKSQGPVISVSLKANRLLYDAKRNKIYASVNGLDVNYGNMLVAINPLTGAIEQSVAVGSEPTEIALTTDTNFLYVALDGAAFVKRVSLNSFAVDRSILLGAGSEGPMFAQDIATVKASADLVVVARKYTSITPVHAGVAAYYKGVKLSGETAGHTGSNAIESPADSNFVIGFNTESTEYGVRKMSVDTVNGVTLISTTPNVPMGNFVRWHNGLVYSGFGKILDPFSSPPTIVGTCQLANTGSYAYSTVAADAASNLIYFCSTDYRLSIRAHRLSTYAFFSDTLIRNAYPDTFQLPEPADIIAYPPFSLGVIVRENYFDHQERRVILLPHIGNPVGIRSYEPGPKLGLYPNPGNSIVKVSGKGLRQISVYDAFGKLVYQKQLYGEDGLSLDLSLLALDAGLYTFTTFDDSGTLRSGKFLFSR